MIKKIVILLIIIFSSNSLLADTYYPGQWVLYKRTVTTKEGTKFTSNELVTFVDIIPFRFLVVMQSSISEEGKPEVIEKWNMRQDSLIQKSLGQALLYDDNCKSMYGQLEQITIQETSKLSCRFNNKIRSSGLQDVWGNFDSTLWVGSVPFGILKSERIQDDGIIISHVYIKSGRN